MGVGKMPRGRWPKTTNLPQLWNRRYVIQRNQAKYRIEEWALHQTVGTSYGITQV